MHPRLRWTGVAGLLLGACRPAPLDLDGARVVLEREPTGLHAADFRPYRVEIQGDGTFAFVTQGLDAVERSQGGAIESGALEELLRAALALDFFALDPAYVIGHNDGVRELLEIELGGRENRVCNYWYGEELLTAWGRELPAERIAIHRGLSDLGQRIDRAVDTRALLASAIALEGPRTER